MELPQLEHVRLRNCDSAGELTDELPLQRAYQNNTLEDSKVSTNTFVTYAGHVHTE